MGLRAISRPNDLNSTTKITHSIFFYPSVSTFTSAAPDWRRGCCDRASAHRHIRGAEAHSNALGRIHRIAVPVGIITAAVLALAAAFAYAKIKKQELINETAEEGAPKVYAMIDKLAKIGVIHQNKAANLKSGIAVYINKLA